MTRIALVICLFVGVLCAQPVADETINAIKDNNLSYFQNSKNIKEIANSSLQNNKTVLMLAVWEGKNQIVEFLLASGAGVNEQDSGGRSALMLAVWKENLALVKALIAKGANIAQKNNEGLMASDLAHIIGNGEIIDFLEKME